MRDTRRSVRPAQIDRTFCNVRHALVEGKSTRLDHSWRELDEELDALLLAEVALLEEIRSSRLFNLRPLRRGHEVAVEPRTDRSDYVRTGT